MGVPSSGTNQPFHFYYIIFQHGFSFPGWRLMTWKFPQSQCLTKSLWLCVCQRICLKTHKPQTKQRLLKTRAVPELIMNITLFGRTKPSFIPSRTLFLCTYLCPSNQFHVLKVAQCTAVLFLPQTGRHCYSLLAGRKLLLAFLRVALS